MTNARLPRSWNRREVLGAGCLLLGGPCAGRELRRRRPGGSGFAGPVPPVQDGAPELFVARAQDATEADLAKALAATKELGIHYWESYPAHVPMNDPEGRSRDARRRYAEAGVSLAAYGVVHLGSDAEANRRVFEFAKSLGLEYLSADLDPGKFDGIDKLVEEFGVAVGIHNHGPGHRYAKIETISDAIKDHHQKIGCCIDTGHFLRSRIDPVDAAEAFAGRTYGVHLKDVKDAKTFTVLGKGDLRTVDLLKVLAKNKYNYCLAIEYEESEDDPVADIKACLAEAAKADRASSTSAEGSCAAMIPRVLEPEAMETPEEVRQYDAMDHSAVNARFVEDFLAAHGPCRGGDVLDVGTGTATDPDRTGAGRCKASVLALDLSEAMLMQAAANIAGGGLVGPHPLSPRRREIASPLLRRRLVRGGRLQHDHPPHPGSRACARGHGPPGRAPGNLLRARPGAARVRTMRSSAWPIPTPARRRQRPGRCSKRRSARRSRSRRFAAIVKGLGHDPTKCR